MLTNWILSQLYLQTWRKIEKITKIKSHENYSADNIYIHMYVMFVYMSVYRFGQDLPLWQSVLVKQSNQLSTTRADSPYPLTDPTMDLMMQTIRPHIQLLSQQPSSFKPFHRDGM